jgi:hypothetical protein
VSNEKINEKIMEVSRKVCGDMDAHLVESIVSLFHKGVLKHYVRTPRSSFNPDNCKLTVDAANGVSFEGREKLIEQQEKISTLEAQLKEAEGIIVWSKKSTIEPSYKVMSLINEYLAKYKVVENE